MVNGQPDIIVRFAEDLDRSLRDDLLERLLRLKGSTRDGIDLGHRGPDQGDFTVRLAVVNVVELDATDFVAIGREVREWIRVACTAPAAYVEIVDRNSRAVARFSPSDPDHAVAMAHRALTSSNGDSPLVWTDGAWQPMSGPEREAERKHILVVCDEWLPRRGGISAFNRYLCTAMAAASATVTCVVLDPTAEERKDAKSRNVGLVEASLVPGGSARERLSRKPALPGGVEPDIVIGHGRITGAPAQALADGYPSAPARLHVVHMQPDQIEWHKLDREDDAATRAETRTREEAALGRNATRIIAVGPNLHDFAVRDLTDDARTPQPVRIDPGFDAVPGPPPDPRDGVPLVLMLGRMEDARLKGIELAARALGHAITSFDVPERGVELLVRGTPEGQAEQLRASIQSWAGRPGLRVTPRNYTSDPRSVLDDVRRSSLVLMPSLEEGFGLVGLEAIAAGVPALISDRSGLGVLLDEYASKLPAEHLRGAVVPLDQSADDVARWAHRIAAVLLDREAAFRRARDIRLTMATACTWETAARAVLAAARATA